MFTKRLVLLTALSGLTVFGQNATPATSAENANLQTILQRLSELDKQNQELRQKVLDLEQKQTKQEADVAAVKTNATVSAVTATLTKATKGVEFKPYGWIKLDAAYDSHQTVAGDAALFVNPSSADEKRNLTFGARETRIGTHILAPEYNGIKVTGRLEADFYGDFANSDKYTPRFRLAYFDVAWGDGWSVRAGQDWDTYNVFHPLTVDAAILGDTGHLYGRHPLLRVSKESKIGESILTLKLAAQNGNNLQDADSDGQRDEAAANAPKPNAQASAVLKTKLIGEQYSTFSLSGAYGQEKLRGSANPGRYNSQLIHGSAQIPLFDKFTIQGVSWYGQNVDTYLGGIGQGVNPTQGKEISAYGGWAQGIYALRKDLKVSLGYGVDNPDDDDLSGDARILNDRFFANAFYNLTDRVTLSTEYSYFVTDYAVTGDSIDNRIQFGAQYTF